MKVLTPILFMLAASFLFACGSVLTKIIGNGFIGDGVHPLQIAHGRFFFAFIFLLFLCIFYKPNLKSSFIKIHISRSIFGFLGVSIWFISVLYIPISDATSINFLNPIFAMILATILLKEKVGLVRWFAGIVSLFGGLILLRPSTDLNFDPITLLCLFGAFIIGLEIICIKFLSGKDHVFKILVLNNFFATCFATLWLPFIFKIPNFSELIGIISIALCFVSGQFFFINSMRKAEASFVMPIFYSTLIFVILLDFIVFNSLPDKISFIGASIIILGALIVTFRESQNKSV